MFVLIYGLIIVIERLSINAQCYRMCVDLTTDNGGFMVHKFGIRYFCSTFNS